MKKLCDKFWKLFVILFFIILTVIYSRHYLYGTKVSINEVMFLGAFFGGATSIISLTASEEWVDGFRQMPIIVLEVTVFCLTMATVSSQPVEVIFSGTASFLIGWLTTTVILTIIEDDF